MKKFSTLAVALLALTASAALAQPTYLTGSITNPAWQPGIGVPIGGGTVADVTFAASGSDYALTLTTAQLGLTAGTAYEYKAAGTGFANPNIPQSGGNAYVLAPASGSVTFTLKVTPFADGFLPDGDGTVNNAVLYNSTNLDMVSGGTITLVGSLSSELGASADWDPANAGNPVLTDAGNGTLGDNIWGYSTTALPAGTYSFKFVRNGAWASGQWGTTGSGGSDLSVTVATTGQTVEFLLNAVTGRSKISVTGGPAIPPGYYATIDTNPITFVAGELMTQVGPNLWAKDFTVATTGYHYARVKNEAAVSFPAGANEVAAGVDGPDGYPFKTTTTNQSVRLYLDRNTYADGLTPASDFIVVVNNDATHSVLNTFTEVQVVGAMQSEILVGDAGTGDWTPDDDGMNLTAGADGVYSKTFTPLASGSNLGWKVLARTTEFTGTWGPAADESIQVGRGLTHHIPTGADQAGISVTTGSPISFTADTKTGRVGSVAGSTPITPSRPSYLTTNTAVQDWSLF